MRLVGLVLQNKKGQNIIMATSNALITRQAALYSNFIYEHILETYRKRLRIERTIILQSNLLCVLIINKDFILYIFVAKQDLSLAFDAVKKITEFINSNVKMFAGSTGAGRLETISKKYVEFMSVMEEFLYTREITIREYLPLLPQPSSKKKSVDQEIFNKFSHISNQVDKKIIFDSHVDTSRIEALQGKRRLKIFDQAKKFVIKTQDECDLLEADPEKEDFMVQYRKNICHLATCGKRKNVINSITLSELALSQLQLPAEELLQEQEVIDQTIERQKIRIRMNEKLQLSLQNAKIKEVLQFGQITVEGTQKESASINLCDYEHSWGNPKLINKRISPSAAGSVTEAGSKLTFRTESNYKSKAILDYIIRKESFTPEKVPLLFVYTRQVSSSNIQFTFKYKVNEKWKHRLFQVDISVYLNKEFLVMDCKSVPSAYSLKNNKITWKTKEIIPNASNSKGKIILAFGSSNLAPSLIIHQIKLTMKANCGLLDSLTATCEQDWGHTAQPEKTLLIEYKITPNDEPKERYP